MKFTLGKKINMTEVFDEKGSVHGVTVIQAGPLKVTKVKTIESDGYQAVQVGYGESKESKVSKAVRGQTKDIGSFKVLREFDMSTNTGTGASAGAEVTQTFKVGDSIDLSVFKEGDLVQVTSTSKGKGFQGVVKRHGFAGGSRTHGQKHSEREPGAIGGGGRAGGRVAKGMRMAGRMGSDTVTVKNLRVIQVSPEDSLILLEGAVPGKKGSLLSIISK